MSSRFVVAGAALALSVFGIGAAPAMAGAPFQHAGQQGNGTTVDAMTAQFPTELSAKPEYRLGDPVELTFTLTNRTGQDYSALEWGTPLERLNGETLDYVQVRHGDRELAYDGRVFKRGVPDASSYRLIRAGESVREGFDLSTAFAITEPGTYTATLTTRLTDAQPGAAPSSRAWHEFAPVELDRASVTFEVVPGGTARPTVAQSLRDTPQERAIKFVGGTEAQRDKVRDAVPQANKYVDNSLKALKSGKTKRYTTWFGSYTEKRHDKVQSHFKKINHDASDLTYDLKTCTSEGVYAYVYPDSYGTIYLCPQFWKAPLTGTDSKAGTLVHEQSHFTVNGGTDDYAYGQQACKDLADSDPDKAVSNADSHEYFAENNPAL